MNQSTKTILTKLKKEYPEARIALNFSNDLELLVAVILSAQCTDKRVNIVTKDLFKKYKTAKDYANADLHEFEQDIRSTGFYRNKAKNIIAAANIIVTKHNGNVPNTMDGLTNLPGVARKTANIVLGNAFSKVEGIAVDTHVKRLSNRLGLSSNTNPEKIEKDLMEEIPKDKWFDLSYMLIDHGRAVCDAKKPKCDECILRNDCPSAFNFPHFN